MDKCIEILLGYFKGKLPSLEDDYSWSIPVIDGFTSSKLHNYKDNVALKYFLQREWNGADVDKKMQVASLIVKDWGGIKTNKPETMRMHIERALSNSPEFPLAGVASYSKIQSIIDPKLYAIYDARVAACLNAVQINYGAKGLASKIPAEGIAFCYVAGRNNVTGNSGNKSGFSQYEIFKVKNLIENGWTAVKRNQCYQTYLEILRTCLSELHKYEAYNKFHLYDLEMVLFSNAEIECERAVKELKCDVGVV